MNPVFFYVPNLIGYGRVVLCFCAYIVVFQSWQMFLVFYGLSQLLDAVDGWAARKLNQTSRFGAVLDQVTDRFSTAGLVVLVTMRYKAFYVAFISIIVLDFVSHWFHMYASVALGNESHKTIPSHKVILKFYYEGPGVMFVAHACNEIFFLTLMCISLAESTQPEVAGIMRWTSCIVAPIMFFKQLTNLLQLVDACSELAALDLKATKRR
uniref:CDP-diacylglycerol--inositol 3-phosphatidyltransferase n=1 Tax=Chromera velia CCMP2878 TaxID=1169474 RepID=A0A0G4HPB6_9ALVE|mmetsp:Transcript_16247/g.32925  ORF Transcript_16247/g.32925 Transcript_16247/m.32925 type:complete len:210 (-) Transcript_16247:163-792(-)|eukprot:Cvel_29769.t1-p1 / transcript=Cvel_29769.t1 / gene=Cvel_29769 / organism=Chromera_velia_CCMP2878 / gene_product=CDP-diacylglycerol--inositol, putative / transcript_product=CDP-diacylglycerol--inositol, putative / location=Cvel_scaffold4135:2421-8744(+) / protein_length=209 / sequence_SO=supercontig / SO=protein_coding / is_pseudo=false